MGEFAGLLFIIFGPMVAAIIKYRKHRSREHMMMRATGGPKAPCKWLVQWDHESATDWAEKVLGHPESYALAAVSVSGPEESDSVIELCLADVHGAVLYESLIALPGGDVAPVATEKYGIENADVENAPQLADVIEAASAAVGDREWLFHNRKFGAEELEKACESRKVECPPISEDCVLLWHALWVGNWVSYEGRYELFPLPETPPWRAHDACREAADVLQEMVGEGEPREREGT